MRLFKRRPSREQVTASTLPHCLAYIFGLHRGRKPAKSEMRGHLKCCVRKVLLHHGYSYNKEEAEIFIDFVYSEATKVEQKLKLLRMMSLVSESPDSLEDILEGLTNKDYADSTCIEQDQEGFQIC